MFNQQLLLFLCNNNYSIFLLDSYSGEIQHYNNFYAFALSPEQTPLAFLRSPSYYPLSRTYSFSSRFLTCVVPSYPPSSLSLEKFKPFFQKREPTAQWHSGSLGGSLAAATNEA